MNKNSRKCLSCFSFLFPTLPITVSMFPCLFNWYNDMFLCVVNEVTIILHYVTLREQLNYEGKSKTCCSFFVFYNHPTLLDQ